MNQAGLALVLTTTITAVVHTLIPDHWLPFVLVSRAEGWTTRRTLTLTAASGLLHVSVSIGLGLMVPLIGLGAEAAVEGLGETLAAGSAWMLIAFGVVYMVWFLMRGGHVHSFGMHPHHSPDDPSDPAAQPVGPVRARGLTGYTLSFIVGFNPCILVIPAIYSAAQMSPLTLVAVAVAFALSTVGSMVAVTSVGLRGTVHLMSPFLTRYGEAVSGGLIALTGIVLLLVDM